MFTGQTNDSLRNDQPAGMPRQDPLHRPRGDTNALGKGRIRPPHLRQVCTQVDLVHSDRNIDFQTTSQEKGVGSAPLALVPHPSGRRRTPAMNDEQLARAVLNDLFPDRLKAKGAREIGIPERTFARICAGTTSIRTENWARLHDYSPFAQAFARAKGTAEPDLDRRTREVMGRLAASLGPRTMTLLAAELETLCRLTSPEKTLSAVERLVETARDFADPAEESGIRQKSR